MCAVNRIFAGRCNKKIRRFAGKKEASGSQYMRFGKNQVGSFAPLNIFLSAHSDKRAWNCFVFAAGRKFEDNKEGASLP